MRRDDLRRPGLTAVVGGVVMLLLCLGSALSVVALAVFGGPSAPTSTFRAGEQVELPGGPALGEHVVYGVLAVDDATMATELGCEVTSPGGTDRIVGTAWGQDAVEVDGQQLEALVSPSGGRAGDLLTCTGARAADFEPLALGRGSVPTTALVVGGLLSVVAAVFGVVALSVGVARLRR